MWYSAIGGSLTIIIGLIVSFMTKPQDPRELNPKLISPPIDRFVRWLFPQYRFKAGWDLGTKFGNVQPYSLNFGEIVEISYGYFISKSESFLIRSMGMRKFGSRMVRRLIMETEFRTKPMTTSLQKLNFNQDLIF